VIDLFSPVVAKADKRAIERQLNSGWVGAGDKVRQFENELASFHGRKFCLCTNSATSALMLAIKAMKPRLLSVPAYSHPAGYNVANFLGIKTQVVDIRPDDFSINYEKVKGTVLHVNHNGLSESDIDSIDDSSHDFRRWGRGVVKILSFSAQKLITTGQGGCVLTNDRALYWKMEELRGGGNVAGVRGNFRMSDVQAAWGLSQLNRFDEILEKKSKVIQWYGWHGEVKYGAWMMCAWVNDAAKTVRELGKKGIGAAQHYEPIKPLPVAKEAHKHLVYLPSHLKLTEREVKRVCQELS
jgi:perosamine synthetase